MQNILTYLIKLYNYILNKLFHVIKVKKVKV